MRQFFLDLDNQPGLVQLALQVLVLAHQLCDLARFAGARIDLRAALLRRQSGQLGGFALAPPSAQAGRVDAFTAQQGADLAGLGAAVCRFQNAPLVGIGEAPPLGARDNLGVASPRRGGRRRFGPLCTRPTGSLRAARIDRIVQNTH